MKGTRGMRGYMGIPEVTGTAPTTSVDALLLISSVTEVNNSPRGKVKDSRQQHFSKQCYISLALQGRSRK